MNVLITGGRGFIGYWLKRQLQQNNQVFISSRSNVPDVIQLDLLNYKKLCNALRQYNIEKIFHLSAQPSVHVSFDKPFDTIQYNVASSLNVVRACQSLNIKLIYASTSEIYKSSNEQLTENSLIEPRSPYTISKLSIDYLIPLLPVKHVILRLFNQTGPGQNTNFVLSSFAKQLADIKFGKIDNIIKVGNLNVQRDFLDIRDGVRAFELASCSEENGIYNVCSGQLYKIGDLLNKLIEIADVKVKIETDPSRLRTFDVMKYYGDYSKIKKLGWIPEIPIEKTLSDLFDYWMINYNQTEIV